MYFFFYLEPVCCSMCSSNCCFLTCIQISQKAGQVVWYSHLFQNFSPQETVKHSSASVSVWSLGPGVHKVCLSPLSFSDGMGFDSKCDFAPHTIFLGLLPCSWMWGISSESLQHLPSCWGFSALGCGACPHSHPGSCVTQPPLLRVVYIPPWKQKWSRLVMSDSLRPHGL